MAISASKQATLSSGVGGTYYLTAYFIENSTNATNNTSNITVTATLKAKSGSAFSVSNAGTLYIDWYDNNTGAYSSKNHKTVASLSSGASTSTTATFNATHRADGTLNGYARARWVKGASSTYTPASGNAVTTNTALTKIPRQSTLSLTPFISYTLNDNITIPSAWDGVVTKSVNTYTHKVYWSSTSGTFIEANSIDLDTDTSFAFYLNQTDYNNSQEEHKIMYTYTEQQLYQQMKTNNLTNIPIYLRLTTYNGETQVGYNDYTINYTLDMMPVRINLANLYSDSATVPYTGSNEIFIKNFSRPRIVFYPSIPLGATLDHAVYEEINYGSSYTANTDDYTFTNVYNDTNNQFKVTAYDSRGTSISNTGFNNQASLTFIDYNTPKVTSVTAERTEATSTTANVSCSGTYTNVNFGQVSNTVTKLEQKVKRGTDSDYTTTDVTNSATISNGTFSYSGTVTNIATDTTCEVKFVVTDRLGNTYELSEVVTKSIHLIEIGDGYFNVNGDLAINDTEVPCFVETSSELDGTRNVNLYDYEGNRLVVATGQVDAYTKAEADAKFATISSVPTQTSQLINNSGFITNTVDNLTNYYTKTNTYNKTEVDNMIAAISTLSVQVVQTLPTQDISTTTIYLVPKSTAGTNDVYNEYMYINNSWELIGTTQIDLSDYVTDSDLTTALQSYVLSSSLATVATSGDYDDLTNKPTIPTVGNAKIYYGTSSTSASTQTKVVTCSGFVLETGATVVVKFTNGQSYNGVPKLNVNSTGAINVRYKGDTNGIRYMWNATEVMAFTYDGTYWVAQGRGLATTTYYGVTKLYTGATSTSTATALTPASLNSANQYTTTGLPAYSSSATYAVGDKVRYGYYMYECNTAITTAEAWDAAHWTALPSVLEQVNTGLASKQNTLVSGTNIKTINNESLLGSGNISISGGQATDVQVNGTSIVSNNVANLITESAYNSSTNKIATKSDIPTNNNQLTNGAGYITSSALSPYVLASSLATVATSGSYNDLSNTPTIPEGITELDGNIRIWELDAGIYKLSDNVSHKVYYKGATDTTYITASDQTLLFITKTSPLGSTYKDFIMFVPIDGYNQIYSGWSTSTTGSYVSRVLSSVETTINKVTSMSSSSTDTQYPSAKAVYSSLSNKANASDIPTKVSDLTNDAGYTSNTGTITSVKMNGSTIATSGEANLGTVLTAHQSIKTINNTSMVGTGNISLPTSSDIPTKVSQLTNDSGFTTNTGTITEVQAYGTTVSSSGVANIPRANNSTYGVTQLSNSTTSDLQYIAASSYAVKSLNDAKQDKLVSGTNIKTINGTSVLGSGDITIGGGGTATNVLINGTTITANNEADIKVDGTYNATSNKIATMSSLPTIDTAMSSTSTNPVQNKVIKSAIDSAVEHSLEYSSTDNYILKMTDNTTANLYSVPTIVTGTSNISIAQIPTASTLSSSTTTVPTTKAVYDAIPTVPSAGTTATAVGTSSSGGSASTYSKSDHKHSISSSTITSALGYTPYNSTNPNNYISGITSSMVTTALGYTPYNSTNPNGYITGISGTDVTTALGYTPQAQIADTGWNTLTLASGFSAATGTPSSTPQYRKVGNHVYIRGLIKFTRSSSTQVFATAASGYIPSAWVYKIACLQGTRYARIGVNPESGQMFIDWVYPANGTSAVTSGSITWLDITMDYWVD